MRDGLNNGAFVENHPLSHKNPKILTTLFQTEFGSMINGIKKCNYLTRHKHNFKNTFQLIFVSCLHIRQDCGHIALV